MCYRNDMILFFTFEYRPRENGRCKVWDGKGPPDFHHTPALSMPATFPSQNPNLKQALPKVIRGGVFFHSRCSYFFKGELWKIVSINFCCEQWSHSLNLKKACSEIMIIYHFLAVIKKHTSPTKECPSIVLGWVQFQNTIFSWKYDPISNLVDF